MSDIDPRLALRARILGLVLREAREARGQTLEACAAAVGVEPDLYAAYEAGEESPSLPELEVLAYFLDVPLDRFWSDRAPGENGNGHRPLPAPDLLALRDRILGARLRQAREAARLSLDDLAAAVALDPGDLAACEAGEQPLPLPELEALAARLGLRVDDFVEPQGPVGEWASAQRATAAVRALPTELRAFLAQPDAEHYLRVAQRLSQLPTARLRAIAESLLEITY